ncbi:MAG TPA: ABC transporter ATP-binding protein [Chitinophagaceae bacterium]|nr:ABC transporter ATP-binding protein [Chitinophagaceae bacterium]
MPAVIQLSQVSKRFRDVSAVEDLSFRVEGGQVYGFLGQNGAGKSTTIRMLLTLVRPSGGSIEVFGMNLERHRAEILRQVGAIIERPDFYKYLSALENLRIFAIMSGNRPSRRQLMDQLDRVGLAARADSKVKTYSQGMKQRLGIATALVHDPQLVILDEPTNGLDPQGIADIRRMILHLSRDLGKTVFVSSHLLAEMELIADSMLIIDRGRKIAEGRVSELLDPARTVAELRTTDNHRAASLIRQSAWQDSLREVSPDRLLLQLHRDTIPQLVQYLVGTGIGIKSIASRHSLEDYFLSLTTPQTHVAAAEN